MYATNLKGVTVFRKRLYRLDASSIIREKVDGDKTRPPYERVYYPPCQELLEFLYKNNVKGVFKVDALSDAKNDSQSTSVQNLVIESGQQINTKQDSLNIVKKRSRNPATKKRVPRKIVNLSNKKTGSE